MANERMCHLMVSDHRRPRPRVTPDELPVRRQPLMTVRDVTRRKRFVETEAFGAPFSPTTPLGIQREAKLSKNIIIDENYTTYINLFYRRELLKMEFRFLELKIKGVVNKTVCIHILRFRKKRQLYLLSEYII